MASKIMNFCDRDIDPTQFELFVGALFCALGYRIEHNGKTHDGGIDLLVRHYQKGKGVVQVKQYRKNTKVTEPQIRDLYGAMSAKQEVEYGIMVVLSDCTREAKTWAQRENVSNLTIWTHKELVQLLEEQGVETLMEFIRLLNQKHEKDLEKMAVINSNYQTPKQQQRNHHYYASSSHHSSKYHHQQQQQSSSHKASVQKKVRGPPSSSLSSAKKRTVKAKNERLTQALINFGHQHGTNNENMDNIRKNWANFKFSDNANNAAEPKNDEGMSHHQNENVDTSNNNKKEDRQQKEESVSSSTSIKRPSAFIHSGEASDDDSSLLLDENHEDESDESPQKTNSNSNDLHFSFNQRNDFSNYNEQTTKGNNDLDTKLLWSLQRNSMNKPRRQRRRWLGSDDILLIKVIQQQPQWSETNDEWLNVFENCEGKFTQQFTLKDVKKHYARVLKPKLLSQYNNMNAPNQ